MCAVPHTRNTFGDRSLVAARARGYGTVCNQLYKHTLSVVAFYVLSHALEVMSPIFEKSHDELTIINSHHKFVTTKLWRTYNEVMTIIIMLMCETSNDDFMT